MKCVFLHLTHHSAHTPGAVGSRHCNVRGAVGGSLPCSRVSPQSWTLPARAGIWTHNLGLPQVSSPTLYPLGHDCTTACIQPDWTKVLNWMGGSGLCMGLRALACLPLWPKIHPSNWPPSPECTYVSFWVWSQTSANVPLDWPSPAVWLYNTIHLRQR